MNISYILILILLLLDCFVIYNIIHSQLTKKEKVHYSLIVVLLPILGIPIYYEIRRCNTKNNGRTRIFDKIFDIVLILIALLIILSVLLKQLSIDSILGRIAVLLALIYNLSYFSQKKKIKMTLLLAAIISIVSATIIKV